MKIIRHIALGLRSGIERRAPGFGERLARLSRWIEDRKTRLAILSVLAD